MAKSVMYRGTGRRKCAVARVILRPGKGVITVNGRTLVDYITLALARLDIFQPLVLTANESTFDISVNVFGGGMIGQAGAIRHGITRALLEVNSRVSQDPQTGRPDHARPARQRTQEIRSQRGARRAPQFSKR
ncbi:MAG: 30S ribosomal protein S9 [Bacillus subtilis]|nr:30S ribosomal protein S9 [Bacillus subtilis]